MRCLGMVLVFNMIAVGTAMGGVLPPVTVSHGSGPFTVDYNGYTGSGVIAGLTAQVVFSNFQFSQTSGNTTVTFDMTVTNNSSAPITASRISGLGFYTTPNVNTAGSSVSGTFNKVASGNMPNVGTVEFCFTNVNCAGGASGGVTLGNSGSASASLLISGLYSTVTFDGFFVRYQSIQGAGNVNSAVGTAVPEPGFYGLLSLGLGGLFLAVTRRKKAA